VRTSESQENIVALSDIREKKLRALSPYGPVKAGLTTLPSQETRGGENEARLTELLNSLESVVESLNFKSFTAYETLNTAIEGVRAALSTGIDDTTGTEEGVL
jgi:hypothetical protein